jgi:GT2 family glycosyltransferase
MIKLTASIVVYKNDPVVLSRTLDSFMKSSLSGELTVVDNSPEDTVRSTCQRFGVNYIFNGENLGFGKAHNQVLSQNLDRSSYHLVLNPDVYFQPDVLEKLFVFMEEHAQAGLVMPKVLYPDGSLQMLCKLLPTPFNLATRRFFPFPNWVKKMNDAYELKESDYNQLMNVPFLSGCFMFMRTEALKKTGLFDERFFLYAEDTDLSRRIHQQFKTMFYPFAEIYHIHARGSYKDTTLTVHNLMSAIKYFTKWGWFLDEERKTMNETAMLSIKGVEYRKSPTNPVEVAPEIIR